MTFCRRFFLALALASLCASSLVAQPRAGSGAPAIVPGARVAIIGDSITEQKLYSKYMEAYLLACSGVPDVSVFQFGWSGETAGGFAGRAENDLSAFQPTVATLCYGMNDGSYQPYKEQIGAAYEQNMRNVLKKLEGLGVKTVVVGSPGAVDTKFFAPRASFGSQDSATGYNHNLASLRDIDRKLAGEHQLLFADVHSAMYDAMLKAKEKLGAEYDVCGRDGFHPGPNGQLLMAYAFLKALGLDGAIGEITIDMQGAATATAGHKVVGGEKGKAELASARWPYCFDGDAKSSSGTRSITPFVPFNEDLNRLVLKVKNLSAPKAQVTWGNVTQEFSKEQLEQGINLAAEFPATPFDAPFQKLLGAVGAKQAFETTMIKSFVTHFRNLPGDVKSDAELQAALGTIKQRLLARQQQLAADAKALVTPVTHTIVVAP